MAISSQQVTGTAGATTGDIRTAETYASDQYSMVQVTSTQLTGGQWIGPAVRLQPGGQNGYLGIYYWNSGSPQLRLYKRTAGNWTQLGSSYSSGPLAAGTQLQVMAVGSKISFLVNGVQRLSVTDTSFTGGAPGIMAYGNPTADNWSGGTATTAVYSVGGTVSGLSGTVVLQDNGGDALSVTANGSFTFATSLAGGAGYSVTVKTNPSGQSCTVSSGSGTVGSANVTNVAVSCANAASYSVGGTVSGLSGTVVLQDNGGDALSVTANGSFTFATSLAGGAGYSVTVKTNPSGQSCTVSSGSGTVGSANVTNVAVSCANAASYSVGGTVSGLSGTVVLQDNGGDDLSVTANGSFTFATAVAAGGAYSVTVKTNPSGQSCTVSSGSGTVGSANVTNVAVSCSTSSATSASDDFNRADGGLGANWTAVSDGGMAISSQQVTGTAGATTGDIRTAETYASDQYSMVQVTSTQLTGGQWIGPAVRLQPGGQNGYLGIYYWNSGSPQLRLYKRTAGNWTQLGSSYSSGPLAAGTQLQVMAVGSKISFLVNGVQRLSVTDTSFTGGAPGIMAYGNPTADNWSGGTATTAVYSVGGTVSGLSGTVVLQDNGGDALSVTANGSFTFATSLAGGAGYSVTVKTNPSGQSCTVSSGSGTVGSANVTNVAVSCANAASYSVGGTVSGLSGTVVLQDNGGDALSVTANGSFTFATSLAGGAGYSVTVKTNPSGQSCTVSSGSGTVGSANVTNVAVSCANAASYSVGGTVSGLSGTVVLQDNGGDDLSVTANGSFTFATAVAAGGAYSVTVKTNPSGQSCTVSSGSGTVGSANVTNVAVSCSTSSATSASDDFNRADGGLGANWTAVSDGGMAISSQQVTGTAGATTGDIRTAETYASDQYSMVQVTSTQLTGGQWIGPAVRLQPGGQNGYLGIYYWNSGSPQLRLYKRTAGNWTQLGSSYSSGPLAAGTQLQVMAVGSKISFLVNGVQRLSVTDTSFTGGAPGIMAYGNPTADNWSGGTATTAVYSVGGTVSGLSGTVVLQDNGGDALSVTANGSFTFATSLAGGAGYSVTVKTNPSGQSCTVSSGSGTVGSANVTNVAVSCANAASYSVGGTVSGLSGTVVLQDNGGDDLSVTANGSFTFATAVAAGGAYSVTVKTNPSGQSCTVSSGSGTVGSANVTNVAVSCSTSSATSASDDFNRADGGLGANWTAVSDGGMAISSQQVTGTAGATTGDIRTAETYASDQYSMVQVTSTQLTGGQWIGPAVRLQPGGQNGYLGIYYWNSGSPQLVLYKRTAGNWTQLGGSYSSGPLAAGTQLELVAVGDTVSFLENGVQRIGVADDSFTGGAPGIIAYGNPTADNWSGGTAGFQADYQSTDAQGIKSYDVISANDGYGPQTLRVLAPTNPAAGVAHNFLLVLPVEAGLGTAYGDGLGTLQALDAQDKYNLTIIEPSFAIDPWYADSSTDAHLQYEAFMTQELVPWIKQHLATTGQEQTWLIGFSKSGIGGEDLILKHPDLFTLAASWDFPADMSSYDEYSSATSYGSDANFQANYRLTPSFLDAHKGPFSNNDRIWIGGYSAFQTDISDYDALLTSEGIAHNTETPQNMAHRWDSGWVPIALAALHQDSINLH